MDENIIQKVRIFDFLVLGPVMIYAGLSFKMNPTMKFIMLVSGIGTIIFNYYEYQNKQKLL